MSVNAGGCRLGDAGTRGGALEASRGDSEGTDEDAVSGGGGRVGLALRCFLLCR